MATSPFDFGRSLLPMPNPEIRIEERLDGDRYVLRAELPGVDPAEDVRVSVTGDELRLDVERKRARTEAGRSEFHYGSFSRTVALPAGCKAETVTASYSDGILEVDAIVGSEEEATKTVPISTNDGEHS